MTDQRKILHRPQAINFAELCILWLSAFLTLLTLFWMLKFCHYGIDFTDDSFYIIWISNPFNYSVSASQFGFIYHPIYKMLDGNITTLRQTNIILNFSLSWILCNVFLQRVFHKESLLPFQRVIISAAIATASSLSLVFSGYWLPTPSYNSLAYQALIVSATGCLLAERQSSHLGIFGCFLIGLGGWLAFMAKPTTAAAIALLTSIYLLLSGKFKIRFLSVAVFTAIGFTLLSALIIGGSFSAFFNRLEGGFEMYNMVGAGHTMDNLFRFDTLQLGKRTKVILLICTIVFFSAAYLSQIKYKILAYAGTALSLAFATASFLIISGFSYTFIYIRQFQGFLICSVALAAMLAGFSIYHLKGFFQISQSRYALAIAFLSFPYAYAFGTGGNYWVSAALSGIFWILAGMVFIYPAVLKQKLKSILLPIGFAVQLISVAIIHSGFESPYRQPQPLRLNDYEIEIGTQASKLLLSGGFGQYIHDASIITKQAGFEQGTPMIDLTGQSPGILYAIGANVIGQAWTVGGYPGSASLAGAMLDKVACQELAKAWLLVEPEGPRKISPEILNNFNANIKKDFDTVGAIKTPEGAGGYLESRTQYFLKPNRIYDKALSECFSTRTDKK